jgi:hypothetical protein
VAEVAAEQPAAAERIELLDTGQAERAGGADGLMPT